MPESNLNVNIGADVTSLVRNLAVARKELQDFAAQLRAAVKAGQDDQIDAASARWAAQDARVRSLSQSLNALRREHETTSPAVTALGQRLSALGTNVSEIRDSFNEVVEKTFPRFREIAALSLAAAGTAFVKLTSDAAKATVQLEDSANAIGTSVNKLLSIQLAGATAGVAPDTVTAGLERFMRVLGTARVEQSKLTGEIQSGVQVLRGDNAANDQAAGGVQVLRGSIQGLTEAAKVTNQWMQTVGGTVDHQVQIFRGGIRPIVDTSDVFKELKINIGLFKATAEGNLQLYAEVAKRIDAMKDSAEKASLAQRVFGRNWAEQIPLITNFAANLKAAEAEVAKYGIAVTHEEQEQAKVFTAAQNTLEVVFGRIRTITGNIVGTALVPLFKGLTEVLGQNQAAIRSWATTAAKDLEPVTRDLVLLAKEGTGAKFETQGMQDFAQVLNGLGIAARFAAGGLKLLSVALEPIAGLINSIFGTGFTGTSLLVLLIIGRLTGAFRLLFAVMRAGGAAFTWLIGLPAAIAAIPARLGALGATFGSLWLRILGMATGARALLAALIAIGGVVGWPVALAAGFVGLIAAFVAFNKESKLAVTIAKFFSDAWSAAVNWVSTKFAGLIDWVKRLIAAFKEMIGLGNAAANIGAGAGTGAGTPAAGTGAAGGVPQQNPDGSVGIPGTSGYQAAPAQGWGPYVGGGGGGPTVYRGGVGSVTPTAPISIIEEKASGGYIRGPGTGTSDSILARLSNGEFVINAAAVRRVGAGFLAGINSLASGGLVRSMPLHFASGGLVAPSATGAAVHLHFPGGSFQLRADKEIVLGLTREARRAGMLSAGRMPGALA